MSNPGGLYNSNEDVSKEIAGSRLHGRVSLFPDTSGVLHPAYVDDQNRILVNIGSSINLVIGSIVMDNALEIQDNDTGARWNINSTGAGKTAEQLADDLWTNGGEFSITAGNGSDITFPFTAQSLMVRYDQDISFYVKPYQNANQLITVDGIDGEFNIGGIAMTGIDIQNVGSDTNITIVAIEALGDTY